MSLELDQLVPCERFRDRFRSGMPVRACLRRQLERQPSTKKGEAGPPRAPYCAETCPLGRAVRSRFTELGLAYCPRCGGALIGTLECATCAERALEEQKGPAKGFLPAARPQTSTVIWGSDAPDAPIGPPPGAPPPPPRVGLAAPAEPVARVRQARAGWGTVLVEDVDPVDEGEAEEPEVVHAEAAEPAQGSPAGGLDAPAAAEVAHPSAQAPAHVAPVDPERPAEEPEKEDPMAKSCSRCGYGLRKDNTKGVCGDAAACKKRAASSGKVTAAPVVARVVGAERAARAVRAATKALGGVRVETRIKRVTAVRPLEGKTVAELLALRDQAQRQVVDVELEFKARQEELAAALEGRPINATAPALDAAAVG